MPCLHFGRLSDRLSLQHCEACSGSMSQRCHALCREVVERGLPVLLAHNFSEGAPLAEQLQALPPPEMLTLLAAVHAAMRGCLTHRRR
jgi:hypothetical protein